MQSDDTNTAQLLESTGLDLSATVDDRAEDVAQYLEVLIESRRDVGDDVQAPQWRQTVIDAATRQMARIRGVEAPVEGAEGSGDTRGGEIEAALSRWPTEIWDDPHALGWIHEQYAAIDRKQSFSDHVHREQKHATSTVSTQLYTPRWVADILARGAIEAVDDDQPTIVDPALGGAQMLLAALAVIAEENPNAPAQKWVQPLWGFDLDGRAVEVARRTLALELARRTGQRQKQAEAICARQLIVGDGLERRRDRSWSVVLTNPPYMGWRSMPQGLRDELDPRFRPYHYDLFSAFIAQCHDLACGAVGILAQQSIWYLRRFEKARRDLYERGQLQLFVHLGAGAFWNLDGEKANVVAFVQNSHGDQVPGSEAAHVTKAPVHIWDLRSYSGPYEQRRAFEKSLEDTDEHNDEHTEEKDVVSTLDLGTIEAIPGRPMCHDLSKELRRLFSALPRLSQFADIPGGQNKTGRNRQFVRRWDEVDADSLRSVEALGDRGTASGRWVFYSKGGRFAPWWGNWDWVVDWSDDARAFYSENRTSNLLAEKYWFRAGICYTDFGGQRFNARWMPPGCVFDMTGPAVFPESSWWPGLSERQRIGAALAMLNSSPARRMLRALNPTLHFQVRDLRALPVPEVDEQAAAEIAAEVWHLVDEVRQLHRRCEGDPLFISPPSESDEQSTRTVDEPTMTGLRQQEARIDARICAWYGVERRPIEGASVCDHHALS